MNRLTKEEQQGVEMRERREQMFSARVRLLRPIERMYEDEVSLEVTHNGFQWFGFSVNKLEAKKIANLLKSHFGF